MRPFTLTDTALRARNAASIARADEGGPATIRLYAVQGGQLLAERTLAVPCGMVRSSDGRIALTAGDEHDLVLHTGAATWAGQSGEENNSHLAWVV